MQVVIRKEMRVGHSMLNFPICFCRRSFIHIEIRQWSFFLIQSMAWVLGNPLCQPTWGGISSTTKQLACSISRAWGLVMILGLSGDSKGYYSKGGISSSTGKLPMSCKFSEGGGGMFWAWGERGRVSVQFWPLLGEPNGGRGSKRSEQLRLMT